MNVRRLLAAFATFACLTLSAAFAAEHATADEAKAMAIKAAQYLREVGPDKAFPAFSAKDGAWHDRDLYVYVADKGHTVVAHGTSPALIGRNTGNLKDVDGKSISGLFDNITDQGWVEYKWQNPVTKAVEPKAAYVVIVGDYHVVVGAYR